MAERAVPSQVAEQLQALRVAEAETAAAAAAPGPEAPAGAARDRQPDEGGGGGGDGDGAPHLPPAPSVAAAAAAAAADSGPRLDGDPEPREVGPAPAVSGTPGGDADSDSDSDTDSSSSVSSSSSSCLPKLSDESDSDDQQSKNQNISKNIELSEQEPPVEDVTIILPESVELMAFGKVSSIIEHLLVIQSLKGLPPVHEDSVLFKENRHSVGKVFEIFGPVSHPFYVVHFNSPEHIAAKDMKIDDMVYFAPSIESFTQYIFPEKLIQERGSDASWKNDEEPPVEVLEFSDDEREREAKKKKKKKSQNFRKKLKSQDPSSENGVQYSSRKPYSGNSYPTGESNPSFSRGGLPYSSIPPNFLSQTQPYSSNYTEPSMLSAFGQPQSQEQYSSPPPLFGTAASNEANHFASPPAPPATWEWPPGCALNIYDPLLTLLSLPPPPPPPLPPPPPASPNNANSNTH